MPILHHKRHIHGIMRCAFLRIIKIRISDFPVIPQLLRNQCLGRIQYFLTLDDFLHLLRRNKLQRIRFAASDKVDAVLVLRNPDGIIPILVIKLHKPTIRLNTAVLIIGCVPCQSVFVRPEYLLYAVLRNENCAFLAVAFRNLLRETHATFAVRKCLRLSRRTARCDR